MECSICYSEITSATGKVELSCTHPFHFSCLTTWFDKQKCQGSHENCPLCRHESNDFEKLPEAMYEEEDEEDDDEDEDEWEEEPTIDELAAQGHASGKFQRLKSTKTPEEVQLYATNLIKACWHGYHDRLLYFDLLENKKKVERHEKYISILQKNLNADLQRKKFLKSIIGLSHAQVKTLAATKIKMCWRRHKVEATIGTMSGVWRKTGPRRWEKIIMNPEEDEPQFFTA